MSSATGVAPDNRAGTGVKASGDRLWSDAATTTLADLTTKVRKRAKAIRGDIGVDAVHDMRTATRRLRTAITIYGEDADKDERTAVEDELRRVARRLGSVRDLDVLLEELTKPSAWAARVTSDDLEPLRRAWQDEREAGALRLKAEIGRGRFSGALDRAERLAVRSDPRDEQGTDGEVQRIANKAPAMIWEAFGAVIAFDIDPKAADPAAIHEMRIAAKKLRYTLEAFEDALEPGTTLIEQVTALQDAGGEMHDAIVARDKARSTIKAADLRASERAAIEGFAKAQDRRAETRRPVIARCLATVRGRAFRESLGRAVAGMGHVSTVS